MSTIMTTMKSADTSTIIMITMESAATSIIMNMMRTAPADAMTTTIITIITPMRYSQAGAARLRTSIRRMRLRKLLKPFPLIRPTELCFAPKEWWQELTASGFTSTWYRKNTNSGQVPLSTPEGCV